MHFVQITVWVKNETPKIPLLYKYATPVIHNWLFFLLRKRWSDATAISMADLTGVAVTDAFCYRLRRWRTDSPSRKGEARRGATHSPLEGWMHSPSSSVASLVFRKCLLSQMYNIANKSLKTHNEPESIKKKNSFSFFWSSQE